MSLKQKIAIFSLTLLLGGCAPSSLEQSLAQAETPRSASDLVSLCTSADADSLAYCKGYIDGATHIWKYWTACASQVEGDQSFCAGVRAAQDKLHEVFQACRDCNVENFRPDLKDWPIRVQLFMERMRKFRDELKATMASARRTSIVTNITFRDTTRRSQMKSPNSR